jgi:23S rRNA pseudouridine955/2504/2580 synthase
MSDFFFRIDSDFSGERIDKTLSDLCSDFTRSHIQHIIDDGEVKVNGKPVSKSFRVSIGDEISFSMPELKTIEAKPENIPLDIIYEDDHILAVNKPAGLLSLDVTGKTKDTMLDRVNCLLAERGETAAFPVHRIDFNTSGILLLAKKREDRDLLDRLIRERKIRKSYLCVAEGRMTPPKGRLEDQLFKDARKNRVYVVDHPVKGSKTAVTEYEVKSYRQGLSLVECHLLTGRTHQIRCQMAHAGHPLLGDDKYGSKEWNRDKKERRQLLCSYKTTFDFEEEGGALSYLSGKTIRLSCVPFVEKYFKGVMI